MNEQDVIAELTRSFGKPNRQGDHLRFECCDACDGPHSSNPLSVNIKEGIYYCHSAECKKGGHISELLKDSEINFKKMEQPTIGKILGKDEESINFESFNICDEATLTYHYLQQRGIDAETVNSLDEKLRSDYKHGHCIYPFRDHESKVVAIQRMFFSNPSDISTKVRRYRGSKGKGVAILKEGEKGIIAEGLETGLSLLQYLGKDHGLIICGDVNGIKSLTNEHTWALRDFKQLIVAIDNDKANAGLDAFRVLVDKFGSRVIGHMPSTPGTDWNDVLLAGNIEKELV